MSGIVLTDPVLVASTWSTGHIPLTEALDGEAPLLVELPEEGRGSLGVKLVAVVDEDGEEGVGDVGGRDKRDVGDDGLRRLSALGTLLFLTLLELLFSFQHS